MPVLILARHAKAVEFDDSDAERRLSDRGLRQAVEAGEYIADLFTIDHAVSSTATRAVQTGTALVNAVNDKAGAGRSIARGEPVSGLDLIVEESLYNCQPQAWLDTINAIPADSQGAYIVGHQPTITEVIAQLCPGYGEPEQFRPSAIAVFNLPNWQVTPGQFPEPTITDFP